MPPTMILLVREFVNGTYRPYGLYHSEADARHMTAMLCNNPDFDNSPSNPETVAVHAWRVDINRGLPKQP